MSSYGAIAEFPYNPQSLKRRFLPIRFNKHYPQVSAAQTVRKWIPKWQSRSKRKSKQAHVKADTEIAKVGVNILEKQGRSPF
jgi:asparagine synthase (glutamine-hydrolysing)